jgi:hypothetical protein
MLSLALPVLFARGSVRVVAEVESGNPVTGYLKLVDGFWSTESCKRDIRRLIGERYALAQNSR